MAISTEKHAELKALMDRVGLREDDLVERFVRAGGPGGQKVNKTSSAVWLKHVPSGMEVKVQTHRSQVLNRFNARRLMAKKMEAEQLGKKSEAASRVAKIQRQKRKRSKRAKAKTIADKRMLGAKKQGRTKPSRDD
jgi:peptide chain release factor